jgi:hypothetical protein
MRLVLLAASLLASAPVLAQQAPAPGQPQSITVTGIRVQDYRDRLAACLARHCPTNEDADATLALAEALFLNGDYAEGRDTVRASLNRNAGNARNFPEPVSDLYRAHSRLSRHLGYDSDARRSAYGILRALREGIPQEDHRHFTARLEIIDLLMRSANFDSARRELERLEQSARQAGREDIAVIAELRMLLVQDLMAPHAEARQHLIQISRLTGADDRMRAMGAKILLSRLYREEGNVARADALLAEVGQTMRGRSSRRLLYAPTYQLAVQGGQELIPGGIPDNFEDKWIDVGFWVMADGHVSGLEVIRNHNNPDWADPLLRSIRGRRYSEGPEPSYRMERYTYTAAYTTRTGTRLAVRSEVARVEFLDLTTDDPPPSLPPSPEPRPN